MAMVGVDSGSLYRQTQPKSSGWSWASGRLAPFYIHQMNQVNSCNDCHDGSTINIVLLLLLLSWLAVSFWLHIKSLYHIIHIVKREAKKPELTVLNYISGIAQW